MNDPPDKNENPTASIAIVGIGCRLPGNVNSPEQFWDVIEKGTCVVTEIPTDRWNLEAYKMSSNRGGFIEDIDQFDHTFFKISPREAASMDPQQRHLLEVTYEAFEDAGIDPWGLQGDCGVFVGIGMIDYSILSWEPETMDGYSLTGTTHSVAANRLSYVFNLKGPSLTVDTACASSMTALHLACCALRNNECSVAVVGGCNTLLVPEVSVGFSALGVMSPDGQCCPFSDNAKGYVRSEGWGSLILKPLDQALSNKDHVYALIRGSAIAASGHSSSLTKPSHSAQQDAMNEVYKRCNISPSSIDYVEAHGTGTPVGDPIEAEAIGKTFSPHRTTPLKIGSVKGNFGHSECAAGVTAAIKVALMLEKQTLCPTVNFQSPNSNIDFKSLNLEVITKLEMLEAGSCHRAAINSFGFAGALAHAVFEKPPEQTQKTRRYCNWEFGGANTGEHIIVPLSAKSKNALEDLVKQWIPFKTTVDALSVVSWLSSRRTHHEARLAVISNSGISFRQLLAGYSSGESGEENVITQTLPAKAQTVCFVFPGQGQQWSGMGNRLYHTEPVFRTTIEKCDGIFKKMSGTSLIHDIGMFARPDGSELSHLIGETDVCQPAILFCQVGLIEIWNHWGVYPDAVVGHSLGEVAAAYACGGLTLKEAVATIYHRSTEQKKLQGTGSMAAIRKSLDEVKEMCSKHEDVYIAAINAPRAITIAGQNEEIEHILEENPSTAKKLQVQSAFHTHHMDPIKVSFEKLMSGTVTTKNRLTKVPLYSTVTGKRYEEDFGTNYWWQNIRQPVQFHSAIECIVNEVQPDVFLELGSSVTLLSSVRQITRSSPIDSNISTIASCQRNKDDRFSILQALGSLYVAGKTIKWENVADNCAQWNPLPSYPWQHQSHWKESKNRKRRRLGLEDRTFKGQKGHLSIEKYPFFKDHVIQNQVIFPGAGYVEYLLQMCFKKDENPVLKNVNFIKTLTWPVKEDGIGDSDNEIVSLEAQKDGRQFHVTYHDVVYCRAEVVNQYSCPPNSLPIEKIRLNLQDKIDKEEFYRRLKKNGFEYGPSFQVVNQVLLGDGETLGYLKAAPDGTQRVHTTILDGCLQLLIAALGPCTSLYIPIKIASFQMEVSSIPPGEDLVAHAVIVECDGTLLTGDVTLATSDGNIMALLKGVAAQAIGDKETKHIKNCLYSTVLQPLESCLNLLEFKAKLSPDYLQREHSKEQLRVVKEDERLIPEIKPIGGSYTCRAIVDPPKVEYNGFRVHEIKNVSIANETPYDGEAKALQDNKQHSGISDQDVHKDLKRRAISDEEDELKHTLFQTEQEFSTPVILETSNSDKNHKSEKECWENVSWNSFSTRVHLEAVASTIVQSIQKGLKEKSVIRVLMVGDRYADLSKCILSNIKVNGMTQQLEYVFSAPTGSILQSTKQELKCFNFVKYEYLDIEQNTDDHGFVPESFDLVVCMFTLHSTSNVAESLLLIQGLLCPRGCLLIYEVSNPNGLMKPMHSPAMSFHLDGNNRHWRSTYDWKDIMTRSGFVDVFSINALQECLSSIIAGFKCSKAIFQSSPPSQDEDVTIIAKDGHLAHVLELCLTNSRKVQIVSDVKEIHTDVKEGVQKRIIVYIHSPSNMQHASATEHLCYVLKLFQESSMSPIVKSLWMLTCGASEKGQDVEGSAAVGLTRAIQNCIHKFPVFSIDLDPLNSTDRNALHVCNLLTAPPPDHEIVIDQGRCLVPRILPFVLKPSKKIQTRKWKIGFRQSDKSAKWSIDDLHFLTAETLPLEDDEVLVEVKAAGLNFKDVMMAMGMLEKLKVSDGKDGLGLECSGVVADKGNSVIRFEIGDEVIVFETSCFASHVKCNQERVVHKPQNLSWVESAGVGIVFSTAFYCLVERAGLTKGETVLIHSACGGVGLAAVQIAQMVGANVICSAGTKEKRFFLKEAMAIKHVTDSRSNRFYQDVMKWTNDKGVDVVLNSLRGDLMQESIALLSHGGRFCEIGKRDILENAQILMKSFFENKSFLSCHVDILLSQKPKKFINNFDKVSLLLMNGTLRPIKTAVHPISAFKETFRMMSKGEHIGKIVFDVSSEPLPTCVEDSSDLFKPNATYMITGGFGGIGLALSRWMCKMGAKHLVLTSRQGCHNAAGRRTLAFLKSQGVVVYEFLGDLSKESFIKTMTEELKQSNSIPPLRGVFHLAGVIKEEGNFLNLHPETLKLMFGSKAESAQFLHDHTLDQPLDMFLLISSSVTVWGNPAQPSYCAANSFLDALARRRHNLGLPALSVQLGPVRGTGFLEDKNDVTQRLADKGALTLHIEEIMSVLGELLNSCDKPVVCLANQNWGATQRFVYKTSLKFCHLARDNRMTSENEGLTAERLEERIKQKLGDLLQLPSEAVDLNQPMTHYGVDSLMAMELITWTNKELGLSVTQLEVLSGMTAASLVKKVPLCLK